MVGEKPKCSGAKQGGLRKLRPETESPGKEIGAIEGKAETEGRREVMGLGKGLFDFIWLPWRDLDPLRSHKERAQTEGDVGGRGRGKW